LPELPFELFEFVVASDGAVLLFMLPAEPLPGVAGDVEVEF